ncbi:TIGR00341 family protein [Salinarchaeum laminariae]|uniref:TIGR00341 family protein n=1 Tax=Salinarchaeum laminariae TaxID=869888 RepID=UPI0020BE8D6E|nr:TIGR00341 family protein [Salinarchaeum laminariae]
MRLVQVTIPTGKRQAVTDALDDEGVDYVLSDETSGREYAAVAHFPLPASAVEPILERLRSAGLDEDSYTIVVEANTVVSRKFDELEEQYAEDTDEDRIARQELRSAANDLIPARRNYLVLTVVSAIVATAGLLLDSPATVVGSMVIAPLVGPALAASVGTVIDDHEMRTRGVIYQVMGIVAAVTSAAAFAFFVQATNLVPPGLDVLAVEEIRERLAPDFLSLAIALGAGVAGALSLSTGVSAALVGVMIAVALIPPAAVVGIGIAWGQPTLAMGSAVLVLVNVLSINLAALAVLWYQGYRPEQWFRARDVRTMTLTRIALLAGVIVVLSVFLGAVTFAGYQGAVAEQKITDTADSTVSEYEQLTLLSVDVEGNQNPLRGTPERAVITIGKPADAPPPQIASTLRQRIRDRLGEDVAVEVRYLEFQTAGQER